MSDDDLVITVRYKDQDSFDLADYGIGQGSYVKYESDPDTLTITMRRSGQVGDDDEETANALEDFEENWTGFTTVEDADPDGELGIESITVE